MTVQEYLKEKPLLFDGAMGTYLVEKHPETVKRNCEFMNIEHPEWVQKIHEKYLKAGAVAIKTNTFSANTVVLQQPVEKVKEMIKKGYQIAQNAIKDFAGERFIFADIGPVPVNEEKDLLEAYKEIANTFLECGAQNFLFETILYFPASCFPDASLCCCVSFVASLCCCVSSCVSSAVSSCILF